MLAPGKTVLFESLESRLLMDAVLHGSSWIIRGDGDWARPDDQITVQVDADDPTMLDAVVNGQIVGKALLSKVRAIGIHAGRGNDQVEIDLPASAAAIRVIVYGGAGNDVLRGGPGNDRLIGEAGNDTLYGGDGNDILWGGAGLDTLYGEAGNDTLYGQTGDDELHGGTGNDRVYGMAGVDQLFGEDGNDLLNGGYAADHLDGGAGDDRLYGSYGNDTIIPGDGQDHIFGGPGRDIDYGKDGDHLVRGRTDLSMGDLADSRMDTFASEEAFRQHVIDLAVKQYGNLLGQTINDRYWWPGLYYYLPLEGPGILHVATAFSADGMATSGATTNSVGSSPSGGSGTSGSVDYSGTNNQVADVEEGDLVKTDGNWIYMILGQQLLILNAQVSDQYPTIQVVSRTDIEGTPSSIFLYGDRVAVTSYSYPAMLYGNLAMPLANGTPGESEWIIPRAYEFNSRTVFTVLDVTDRQDPTLVQKTSVEGSLVDARAIDDQIVAVTENNIWLPPPAYQMTTEEVPYPDDYGKVIVAYEGALTAAGATDTAISTIVDGCVWRPGGTYTRRTFTYESAEAYAARLETIPMAELLPSYSTTGPDGVASADALLMAPTSIFAPPDSAGLDLLSLLRIDMSGNTPGPVAVSGVQGAYGQVYASRDSLYVVSTNWNWAGADTAGLPWNNSRIYKFDLNQTDMPLVATGVVEGYALNQFSMDEYNGEFRIATTSSSWWWGGNSYNSVFVLQQQGHDLVAQGVLTNLAPSEHIYSVRFVGDLAYMVTFRQVDPLFVIDLSDPTTPYVAGELKVPGYSSYLHPMDDTHLIGLGYDADANGRITSLKLSLFDVADPTDPKLVDSMLLTPDGTWGYSQATWDHHAFSYFAEQGVLALPVWACWQNSSLDVISVDPTAGFTQLGSITQTGWSSRSLRIGDNIYAISNTQMTVADLMDPSIIVATVDLAA